MSDAISFTPPPRSSRVPEAPAPAARPIVALSIDGREVAVADGATVLDACAEAGVETPTLCFLSTLTPVNACRVCVVELEGARPVGVSPPRGTVGPIAADDAATGAREAERIGFPVLVKAAGGGGGIGLQVVDEPAKLARAVTACSDRGRSWTNRLLRSSRGSRETKRCSTRSAFPASCRRSTCWRVWIARRQDRRRTCHAGRGSFTTSIRVKPSTTACV